MTISELCTDDARKMDYLCGDVSPEEKREMERHMKECPACRAEIDDLRILGEQLIKMARPECPEGLARSVVTDLERYERLGRRFRRQRQIVLAALGALSLTVVFVLASSITIGSLPRELASSLAMEFEAVRFIVVLAILLVLPACLDSLGFLVVRRSVMAE